MSNGDFESAVRILPADGGGTATSTGPREPRTRTRWIVPGAAAVTLLALVALTRPGGDNAAATSTTQPPAISAVSTELIDISSAPGSLPVTEDWQQVEFSPTASVNGVIRLGASLVAYGSNRDGAAAWTSEGGSSWRDVSRFEAPSTSKSSIEHTAVRDGTLVALGDVNDGIGLWTAQNATTWAYHGLIPDMDAGSLIGVAATDQVVALTGLKVGQEAWVSPDGLDWIYHGEIETLDVVVLTMEAHNGWFYAGGRRNCEEPPCPAVIYRSRDGLTWEPTDGPNPGSLSGGRGAGVDIATTSNGLLAGGHADDRMAGW